MAPNKKYDLFGTISFDVSVIRRLLVISITIIVLPMGWAAQSKGQPTDEPSNDLLSPWTEAYEALAEGIQTGRLKTETADQFYGKLNEVLRVQRSRLHDAFKKTPTSQTTEDISSSIKETSGNTKVDSLADNPQLQVEPGDLKMPEIEQLVLDMKRLYSLRVETLRLVSADFHARITGTGITGIRSLKEEIDYLVLTIHYHLHLSPQTGKRMASRLMSAPLPALFKAIQIIILVLVFIMWRRWAAQGIPNLRNHVITIRPRKPIHTRLARILWYVNRVRLPIELLIFLTVVTSVLATQDKLFLSLLWTKGKYILFIWFTVIFVDALAARGAAGLNSRTASLRLRTIWTVAIWFLVSGLMIDISEDLTGTATMYSWSWIFAKVMTLPMLILLIYWWRPEIYKRLENDIQQSSYTQKILQHNTGLESYLWSVFGAVRLIGNSLRQLTVRTITATEGGRYFIANLTRMEAVRVSERQKQTVIGEPISSQLRQRLFEGDGRLVKSVGMDALEWMVSLVEQGQRGEALIVAERGGGKSQLFVRLDQRLEVKMVLFDCPPGGGHAFRSSLANALNLEVSELTPKLIADRIEEYQIRAIGIDNLHRLARPAMGGQKDIDEMTLLLREVKSDVLWFLGVDWTAWQYISRVRANRLFVDEVINLPLWSEAQIQELIEQRCEHAGIRPDFSELTLPRHFEDADFENVEEQNRFGYFRILWNASDGNPVVALQLWIESIRISSDGRVLVFLPHLSATTELENTHITVLMMLRVIAQSGYASLKEIAESMALPETEVASALRHATTHEWVELMDDRYRLTWKWFRPITRVLARQNLLVRRTLGA